MSKYYDILYLHTSFARIWQLSIPLFAGLYLYVFMFDSVCVVVYLRRVQQSNHYMLDIRARTDFKYRTIVVVFAFDMFVFLCTLFSYSKGNLDSRSKTFFESPFKFCALDMI